MTTKRTVYAVTQGSYSDYSVRALFTDEALAIAHAAELPNEPGQVEEFPLLDEAPTQFVVYSMSNDTYLVKPDMDKPHEWQFLQWSYARGLYRRAEVNEWRKGSVRVEGWDKEAVAQAFRDRVSRIRESSS
jgi:hypothetical protein